MLSHFCGTLVYGLLWQSYSIEMNMIILALIIFYLLYTEYGYRANRDGSLEARRAMLFACIVFGIGWLLQTAFGMLGLVYLLVFMLVMLVLAVRKMRKL